MSTADVVILSVSAVLMIPLGIFLRRYTRLRIEAANELRRQGWIQVDCNFLLGPIMVPPPREPVDEECRRQTKREEAENQRRQFIAQWEASHEQ